MVTDLKVTSGRGCGADMGALWMKISDAFWLRSDGPRVQVEADDSPGNRMLWFARRSGNFAEDLRHPTAYGGANQAMDKADDLWPRPQMKLVIPPWREDQEFVSWLHLMGWVWSEQEAPHRLRDMFDSDGGRLRMMYVAWRAARSDAGRAFHA